MVVSLIGSNLRQRNSVSDPNMAVNLKGADGEMSMSRKALICVHEPKFGKFFVCVDWVEVRDRYVTTFRQILTLVEDDPFLFGDVPSFKNVRENWASSPRAIEWSEKHRETRWTDTDTPECDDDLLTRAIADFKQSRRFVVKEVGRIRACLHSGIFNQDFAVIVAVAGMKENVMAKSIVDYFRFEVHHIPDLDRAIV
jgi:hypothetical protein